MVRERGSMCGERIRNKKGIYIKCKYIFIFILNFHSNNIYYIFYYCCFYNLTPDLWNYFINLLNLNFYIYSIVFMYFFPYKIRWCKIWTRLQNQLNSTSFKIIKWQKNKISSSIRQANAGHCFLFIFCYLFFKMTSFSQF